MGIENRRLFFMAQKETGWSCHNKIYGLRKSTRDFYCMLAFPCNSPSLPPCLSFSLSFCPCDSLSVSLSLCLSPPLSLYFFLSLCLLFSLSFCLYDSLCLSPPLSFPVCSFSLSLSLSLSVCVTLSVSPPSLPLFLSVSLSRLLPPPTPPPPPPPPPSLFGVNDAGKTEKIRIRAVCFVFFFSFFHFENVPRTKRLLITKELIRINRSISTDLGVKRFTRISG